MYLDVKRAFDILIKTDLILLTTFRLIKTCLTENHVIYYIKLGMD
jgi:hypothetical protein